jgi:hypothetical protein
MSKNFIITAVKRNAKTPKQLIVSGINLETKQMSTLFVDQNWLKTLGMDLTSIEMNQISVPSTKTVAMVETDPIGSTFVADRDSTRTKGAVLGADCPSGKEDEPLYFAGETITRQQSSDRLVALVPHEVYALV